MVRSSDSDDAHGDSKHALHVRQLDKSSQRMFWRSAMAYIIITALAVSLTTISTLYIRLQHKHAVLPLLTCGTSVAEAEQAGCSFDRLTKAWLPAECSRKYEREFLEYPAAQLNMSQWRYYEDASAQVEITDAEMAIYAETKASGEMSWVSTTRMHLAHCAFVMMRRADAYDTGKRMDHTTEFATHAKHCLSMLLHAAMKAPDIDIVQSKGEVGFGAC